MSHLKVFSISDGKVAAKGRLPAILKQTAVDAYNNASGVGGRFDQARVEELIACAKKLLADSKKGIGIPHLYNDDDNEAEKLNDLLCRGEWEKKKFNPWWKPHLRDSEHVHSAQVMAAYALLQIDAAATLYLASDWKRAFTTMALATVATADYGFHLGFSDRNDLVIEAGHFNSKKSTRLQGASAARRYAVSLWRHGQPTGGPWPTKQGFAKTVKDDVMAFAAKHGLKMISDNAVRTIREWIVAEEKTT